MIKDNDMHTRKVDVAVFGAGPAGIAAAVTAAREGQKVCLVEVQNKIGGVMTSSPGMMLGGGYPCKKSIGGFFEEFTDRMFRMTPPVAERRVCSLENFGDEVVYDHEYAIALLYEMLAETGVEILVNRIPYDLTVENDSIRNVFLASVEGREMLSASMYIDCTGNGDIAVMAGVPYAKGDMRGKMMGATLSFFMENVDMKAAFPAGADPYLTAYADKAIRDNRIHKTISQIYMLPGFRTGSVFFNTVTVTEIDGTSPSSVHEGTVIARKRMLELVYFLVEDVPGFRNSHLADVGHQIGVRETRRLEGIRQLTSADIAGARKFDDAIVSCDNPHDEVFRDSEKSRYAHEAALEKGQYYTIPFGCLVPKKVRNILFAGRNISVDSKAFSSIRGMPQCMVMGQAAGLGAAAANNGGCAVQDIDTTQIVAKLLEAGVAGIGGRKL